MNNFDKKILVVDDSESIREVVSFTLEKEGYKVMTRENGQEALKFFENPGNSANLLLTDLNMPVMDGLSLVKKVRKIDRHKYMPIIILTTESQANVKDEARKAGATGWIVKPFADEQLVKVLKRIIG